MVEARCCRRSELPISTPVRSSAETFTETSSRLCLTRGEFRLRRCSGAEDDERNQISGLLGGGDGEPNAASKGLPFGTVPFSIAAIVSAEIPMRPSARAVRVVTGLPPMSTSYGRGPARRSGWRRDGLIDSSQCTAFLQKGLEDRAKPLFLRGPPVGTHLKDVGAVVTLPQTSRATFNGSCADNQKYRRAPMRRVHVGMMIVVAVFALIGQAISA